jgi:hypothetical protein
VSGKLPLATLVVMALLGSLTGCFSSDDDDPRGDEAVWGIVGLDSVSEHSRGFDVLVSRVGCSSGRQGTPEKPVIDVGESTIVVTFRMAPHVSGAQSCQGTAGVPYHVRLHEPIGQRTLVDGECHRGSEANATAFCSPDGVRLSWRDGRPRLAGSGH